MANHIASLPFPAPAIAIPSCCALRALLRWSHHTAPNFDGQWHLLELASAAHSTSTQHRRTASLLVACSEWGLHSAARGLTTAPLAFGRCPQSHQLQTQDTMHNEMHMAWEHQPAKTKDGGRQDKEKQELKAKRVQPSCACHRDCYSIDNCRV